MKRIFTLIFLSFLFFGISHSQITHEDFGEGLVFDLNSNIAIDIDNNASTDFYINQYTGELGITAIFSKGCIASEDPFASTDFGAREMQLFQEGDEILLTNGNLFDYIDEDRGSAYSVTSGFADFWERDVDYYIGFALIDLNNEFLASNGWIKLSVNDIDETLTIKEWAFTEYADYGLNPILAGQTENSPVEVNELSNELADIQITPNPAVDNINLSFNYLGEESLNLSLIDNTGKVIMTKNVSDLSNYSINTESISNGLYFIHLSTSKGTITKKVFVTK